MGLSDLKQKLFKNDKVKAEYEKLAAEFDKIKIVEKSPVILETLKH